MRADALAAVLKRAAGQHDVITVPQASALGVSQQGPAARAVRSGRWRRLHRGVCWTLPVEEPSVLTVITGARLLAGGLTGPGGVVVGGAAARLWGLSTDNGIWMPELALPPQVRRPQPRGLRYRWPTFAAGEVTTRAGVPVTTVERTLLDLSSRWSAERLLIAGDAALRGGVATRSSLATLAQRMPAGRRAPLLDADGRAESVFESRVRAELLRAGLPRPTLQYEVRDRAGRLIGRLDLAWPGLRLAVEADGVATHAGPQALRADLRRQNALVAEGWTLLRFTWADLGSVAPRVGAAMARARVSVAGAG